MTIPVIDISLFKDDDDKSKQQVGREIVTAYKSIGFVYVRNHGISEELLADVYNHAAEFFKLPMEEKMKLEWDNPESNRGYSPPGREKVTNDAFDKDAVDKIRQKLPDQKEAYNIGNEESPIFRNQWPSHNAEFKPIMIKFWDACHELNVRLMRAIALGLGLPETFFDLCIDERDNTLRILRYHPIQRTSLNSGALERAGAHTDYGSLTLLFQDDAGGLQVKNSNGEWIDAVPIPGTVVVNAGDLLQRWTNDVIKSTEHRVVSPPTAPSDGSDTYLERYSIPFFCSPNPGALIEGLPGVGEGPGKYEPVKSGEYLAMRLAATY